MRIDRVEIPYTFRALLILALAAGGLLVGPPRAAGLDPEEGEWADQPRVIRIFYLEGMDPGDAGTLLRSEVKVRSVAMVEARGAVIVSDVAESVDRSESLLRERGVVVDVADPHPPVNFQHADEQPESWTFWVEHDDFRNASTILRAIYGLRVTESADDASLSIHAPRLVLDAVEAVLNELDMLVDSGEAPEDS